MLMCRLSSNSQVTIPQKIRRATGLKPGDTVTYSVRPDGVIELRRVDPFDLAFHAALSKTMTEWSSPEDEAAFGDL